MSKLISVLFTSWLLRGQREEGGTHQKSHRRSSPRWPGRRRRDGRRAVARADQRPLGVAGGGATLPEAIDLFAGEGRCWRGTWAQSRSHRCRMGSATRTLVNCSRHSSRRFGSCPRSTAWDSSFVPGDDERIVSRTWGRRRLIEDRSERHCQDCGSGRDGVVGAHDARSTPRLSRPAVIRGLKDEAHQTPTPREFLRRCPSLGHNRLRAVGDPRVHSPASSPWIGPRHSRASASTRRPGTRPPSR